MDPIKPMVGVITDVQTISPHTFHLVGDKYVRALLDAAGVLPVAIPCLSDVVDIKHWLKRLDGLFLTGAYSMVCPSHYGEQKIDAPYDYDPRRDHASFQAIEYAKEQDIPLLGVCRGFQDINVYHGGSLHQKLTNVDNLIQHHEDKTQPLDAQYAPIHELRVNAGTLLHTATDVESMTVNSLHSQGIKELGEGLTINGTTSDGLIEAIAIDGMTYGLGVQWHPEWKVLENPIQQRIFNAFGAACRNKMSENK